jgi:hypothetical protein
MEMLTMPKYRLIQPLDNIVFVGRGHLFQVDRPLRGRC